MRRVVSGVALRTLATRGRKREGPTPKVWEGWSKAEGPKDNTACGHPANQQLCAWEGWSKAEGPKDNTACDHPAKQ